MARLGRRQPNRPIILHGRAAAAVSPIIPVGTDGHVEATSQNTSVTSALPTGITDGDYMLLEVAFGSGGTETTITTPAGWTKLTEVTGLSTKDVVFWRFFVTGDTAPTFTLSTARAWCSHSTAFRGVDTTTPINTSASLDFASASSYTSSSITPSVDLCMIVACWGGKTGTDPLRQTVTIPAGWTDTVGGTSSPTSPNQSTIAAVNNNWSTFQYQSQGIAAAVSEAVTVANSATCQNFILALTPSTGATAITLSDTGAAADSFTVTVAAPLSDSGASTDGLAITATVPLADSGVASDTFAVSIPIFLADTGSATDSFTVAVAVPLADVGSATDTASVAAQVPLADSGTGVDSISVVQGGQAIALADTGTASDSFTVTAAVPLTDAGQATDTLAVTAAVTLADTGSATDSFTVQQIVPKPLSDSGVASDSLAVTAAAPLAELGAAADTLAVQALLGLADVGVAVDSFTVQIVGPGAPIPGTLTAADQPLATLGTTSATGTLTVTDKMLATLGSSSVVAVLTATAVMAGGPS